MSYNLSLSPLSTHYYHKIDIHCLLLFLLFIYQTKVGFWVFMHDTSQDSDEH